MHSDQTRYDRNYFENILQKEVRNSPRNQNRLKLALSLKSDGKLLEIGCGKGHFLRMASRHYTVEGVDISQHAIESMRHLKNVKVWRTNVETDSLANGTYDLIAAFNILEHLHEPGLVIEKLWAALKPGGYLIGSVPLKAAVLGRIHTALSNVFDITHCSTFHPAKWRRLFDEAGFAEVTFFGEMMFGKSTNLYVRHRLWKWFSFNLMFQCRKGILEQNES